MKRRIVSFILALVLLFTSMPQVSLPVSAADTSGNCGDNLTWSYEKASGALIISGTGAMYSFYQGGSVPKELWREVPWMSYQSSITEVTLQDGITSIGAQAFQLCSSLKKVFIPNSVTSIGESAFANCSSLASIQLNEGLLNIGPYAFAECSDLNEVIIPKSVTSIGGNAFWGCTNLNSITVNSQKCEIGGWTAYGGTANYTLGVPEKTVVFGFYNSPTQEYAEKNNYRFLDIELGSVWNGHTYKMYDDSMTWVEAKAFCEEKGGHLVTITSQEEQAFIESLLSGSLKRGYWMGANKTTGSWSWVTGEPFNYTHWASGQPDYSGDYLDIFAPAYGTTVFYWDNTGNTGDGGGGLKYKDIGFICEWDSIDSDKEKIIIIDSDTWSFKNPSTSVSKKYWKTIYPGLIGESLDKTASKDLGLCYGMTGTAICLNSAYQSPSDFSSQSVSQITKQSNSTSLKISALDYIKYMFVSQAHPFVIENVHKDLNDLVTAIKDSKSYDYPGVNIGISGRYFGHKNHSIWGISVKEYSDHAVVLVYDSNHPGEQRYLTLQKNASGDYTSWSYQLFDGFLGIGKTIWGTDKKDADIEYSGMSEMVLYMLPTLIQQYNTNTKGITRLGADMSIKDYSLVNTNNYTISQPTNCLPIRISGVTERTDITGDPEDDKYCTEDEKLYWVKNSNLFVSGSSRQAGTLSLVSQEKELTVSNSGACSTAISFDDDCLAYINPYSSQSISIALKTMSLSESDENTLIIQGNATSSDVYLKKSNKGYTIIGIESGEAILEINNFRVAEVSFDSYDRQVEIECSFEKNNEFVSVSTKETGKTALPCNGKNDCPGSVFSDMPAKGNWAHDPIDWATVKNVTNGTDATHFSPDSTCTRAQVVTFLWRANGCPEPQGKGNPFTDVKLDAYYYKAVLWAVEQGITTGTSTSTFSPNSGCTRGQVVTFLWRANEKPELSNSLNPFGDVGPDEYFSQAVLWAVEEEITNGTSAIKFSPNLTCTRAQIVTFLYRTMV